MRVPGFLLREDISVEAYGGAGARGATYGSAVTIRAAMQTSSRVMQTAVGTQTVVDLVAIIRPENDPPVQSRITWLGRQYRVLASIPMPDSKRPSHRELALGALL